MSLKVEKLNGLNRQVVISIKVEEFNDLVKQGLIEKRKKVKISGFRPGKVPLNMVDNMYGGEIRENIISQIATKEFIDFVNKEKIKIVDIQKLQLQEKESNDKEIKVLVLFDVYPDEININDLSNIEIEKILSKVTNDDVEHTINMLREQKAQYKLVDRGIKKTDKINIDFEGKIGKEVFEGGSAQNYTFVIGKNQMIPDFEEGILGMKTGEEKVIKVQFPKDYSQESLANKKTTFTIKVNKVEEIILPKMDTDFIKSLGIEDGKLTSLKKEIKSNLEREVEYRTSLLTKNNVIDVLLKNTKVELPESLLNKQLDRLMNEAKNNMLKQGVPEDRIPPFNKEDFKEKAENSVTLSLIFRDFIEKNKLKATDTEIKKVVSTFAQNYENPKEYIEWYLKNKNNYLHAENIVLEDKVIDIVLKQAKIKNKEITFQEVMNINY